MTSIKHLLSLPPSLVSNFHEIYDNKSKNFYCTSDPAGKRVGSGGGTSWLLSQCWQSEKHSTGFSDWLHEEKRILIHAGGQSRRLPAYAPLGKILTPIPVFRWKRGQQLNQTLLDLQSPLYQKIINSAPKGVNTLIASGDVLILNNNPLQKIPEADVVCYGLWTDPKLASRHGVFICEKNQPQKLIKMLQKPSEHELQEIASQNLFLMDIGVWLLSNRAVEVLMKKSGYQDGKPPQKHEFYDLYSQFGPALGDSPTVEDEQVSQLTVAIIPFDGGEFYHYGTSKELISSTLSIQNRVNDQRSIHHKDKKPHPSMFIQNAVSKIKLEEHMQNLWIENSFIGGKWKLNNNHIITGIPENNWDINLPAGMCIDMIPVGNSDLCLRTYHIEDKFAGVISSPKTGWNNTTPAEWLSKRHIKLHEAELNPESDIQDAKLFPVCKPNEIDADFINWLINGKDTKQKEKWIGSARLSATEIADKCNFKRLKGQRNAFRNVNWPALYKNSKHSVFYQIDLNQAAKEFANNKIAIDNTIITANNPEVQMHQHMFKARVLRYNGSKFEKEERKAFDVLRQSVIEKAKNNKQLPRLDVFQDQIVWGRSPVRIDLAGGWTDTPPYCILEGGRVVNIAINLNGQQPLQAYVKTSSEKKIIIRSIDLGTRESITSWEELSDYNHVGSAFSIPKAALCLIGFHPDFCQVKYNSLRDQLEEFGSGLEISMLAAIPKGSGLGTSSVLASTVLGALADFCGLSWDQNEICQRTLILEQMLTTGGGWQDQYGGVLQGVKLLETNPGIDQIPLVRWTPDFLFTRPEYKASMMLYYTGITRTAKNILAEIVRGMFLNSANHLSILQDIKDHASYTFDVIQQGKFTELAACISKTWMLNQNLDTGTNTPEIQQIIDTIEDLTLGYKLPGAGGGGYMFIIAKDPEAAAIIKHRLKTNPPNNRARFVEMDLSQTGFQATRS